MVKVTKDGMIMAVKDINQLAAFLNNGWKKVTEEKPVENHEVVSDNESEKNDDSVEETQKNDQPAVAEPLKRGRKPKQK